MNEYFDMIKKADKLYSEYKSLKNKIENPFEEDWQNEIFKLLRSYSHIAIWKIFDDEEFDGDKIFEGVIKKIYPSNNYKDIILEFDDFKIRVPKKWGKPKLTSFF